MVDQARRERKICTYIYNLVKSEHKIPLKRKGKSSCQYYVNKLKNAGIIARVGYGTWEIKKPLEEYFLKKEVQKIPKGTEDSLQRMRAHGYIFSLQLKEVKGWERREQYLKSKDIKYKLINHGKSCSMRIYCTKYRNEIRILI